MKRVKMPEDSGTNILNIKHGNTAKMPQLPPVAIDSMSQGQLRDFIPNLLRMVTGKSSDLMAKDSKPDWWPHDVPWSATKTDTKHQEFQAIFLQTKDDRLAIHCKNEKYKVKMKIMCKCAKHCLSGNLKQVTYCGRITKTRMKAGRKFSNRDDMRNHQAKCNERPPELQAVKTPPRSSKESKGPPPMSPKFDLTDHFVRPLKDVFIKAVNILPVQKAERIRARKRTNSMEIDCDKLDLDDPMSPISPTTPRTPKSLISQLSRDDNIGVSKKRLSYSEPVDNSDKESVASGCSEDTEEKPTQKGKSLLNIDVTSLLGQRIQKHVHTENSIEIVLDSENFCKTPKKNDFLEKLRNRTVSFPVTFKPKKKFQTKYFHKYKFTRKQRKDFTQSLSTGLNRDSRALKRSVPNCKVVLARLTKRELKKWLSPYMYKKALGTHVDNSKDDCLFPKDPVLLSKDLDRLLGLKRRSCDNKQKTVPPLQLANVVSEDVNGEISKQKLTLYRCLLTEVSGLGSSFNEKYNKKKLQQQKKEMKSSLSAESSKTPEIRSPVCSVLEQQPLINNSLLLAISPMSPFCGKPMASILQNTTPDFGIIKKEHPQDDNISILSISSDEESFKPGCCSACKVRCRCTPEGSVRSSPHVSPPLKSETPINAKLNVPLNLESICRVDLPVGNLSPPESEADVSSQKLVKNTSRKSDCVNKVIKEDKSNKGIKKTSDKVLTRSKSSPEKTTNQQRRGSLSHKLEPDLTKTGQPSIKLYLSNKDSVSKLRSSPRKLNNNTDVVQVLKRKSVSSPAGSPRKRGNSIDILNDAKGGSEVAEPFRRSSRIGSTSSSPYASPSKIRRIESSTQ
ncbi:hypothetical protein KUTeg_020203 [Tegillarca granosa]|uniref:Nuclear respiratory factor 1 NLS/DNA-binding dimerisation domain-containing protein n=1 Tax=Tegillarca granosa TaxID=220873 RepID=A0ABQ9E9X9_TEGGR|nr:hypothetical protein KUTeg_020203 [Tegillarca granosa]